MPTAVLGYGVTGRAISAFLGRRGIPHKIFDRNEKFLPLGVANDFCASGDEFVLHSPGFVGSSWLRDARRRGCIVMGELDYGHLHCERARTIAVTGTLGKTSTAMALVHALGALGERCVLSGNVGNPFIGFVDELARDRDLWNVCEVSSFQACDIEYFSPDYVLWTNFSENHLDVHCSMENYWSAKWRLLNRCRRIAYVGEDVAVAARSFGLQLPPFASLPREFLGAAAGEDHPMAHQRANLALVRSLLCAIGFDFSAVNAAMVGFQTPRHRLQMCRSIGSVEIWNDSKATTAAATMAALRHVVGAEKMPCLWLCCGRSKGENLENFRLAVDIASEVLCFGEIAGQMAEFFGEKIGLLANGVDPFSVIGDFIGRQRDRAAVVFSPGFTSFDSFSSYAERGAWFCDGIAKLQ
jgi:UDP-N-acetylmuramoylalanine--D-glutamate ligase